MRTDTRAQILDLAAASDGVRVADLVRKLAISPQAVHRHLRRLCQSGALIKVGDVPRVRYRRGTSLRFPAAVSDRVAAIREILSSHPAIHLVTLFGSQARGDAKADSDIDLLVWLGERDPFDRKDIWSYWDRQASQLLWRNKVSLVVRRLAPRISIDTLLLDLPEEHLPVFDRRTHFASIRTAVEAWRKRWGAKKLASFGGTHSWLYSTKAKCLSEIDFRLEISDVA